MKNSIVAILALLSPVSANSATIVLDFEEYADSVSLFQPVTLGTVLSDEFEVIGLTSLVGWDNCKTGPCPPPSPEGTFVSAVLANADASIEIGRIDGNAFDLVSLQHLTGVSGNYGFTIVGNLSSGGTVSQSFTVFEDFSGYDTTVLDSALFSGITSYSIELDSGAAGGFWIDNMVVTTVPIPAAVWLFGSALIGLGAFRRRKFAL